MNKMLLTAVFVTASMATAAQTYQIPLWPDGPSEHNGITEPEIVHPHGGITNISEAWLSIWPAEGDNTGMAVVICPGGGYTGHAARHEGSEFAEWLSSLGVTAAVLKYRLPNGHSEIPVTDARQAMKSMRNMAPDLGIDPQMIGIMGFSAGGHLASTLLTRYDEGSKPDFGILFYPVITMGDATHAGSRLHLLGPDPTDRTVMLYSNELNVTADTPPTLLFYSENDEGVPPVNGFLFHDALRENGVRTKLVLYPSGGHGWGFNRDFEFHDRMKTEIVDWLEVCKNSYICGRNFPNE